MKPNTAFIQTQKQSKWLTTYKKRHQFHFANLLKHNMPSALQISRCGRRAGRVAYFLPIKTAEWQHSDAGSDNSKWTSCNLNVPEKYTLRTLIAVTPRNTHVYSIQNPCRLVSVPQQCHRRRRIPGYRVLNCTYWRNPVPHVNTGWFERKRQYFGWRQSVVVGKKFIWICVKFWMGTETELFESPGPNSDFCFVKLD